MAQEHTAKERLLWRPKTSQSVALLLLAGLTLLLAANSSQAAAPPPAAASILNVVDDAAQVGEHTSLALNSSGNPVIGYYDAAEDQLKVAVCSDAACSSDPTINVVDSDGDVGKHTSLALNRSGNPVISYYDDDKDDLKVAVCNDAVCDSDATINIVDSDGDVGSFTSLALNRSGNPVISYWQFDSPNSVLKVAVCKDAACSTTPSIKDVDSGGDTGRFTSLALNSSDFPVISYDAFASTELKLAVCLDKICADKKLTVIDSIADFSFSSLALNRDDVPIISYLEAGAGHLKLGICNDSSCKIPNLITVDSGPKVGVFPAVALNSQDLAVISYYDAGNDDLKVAVCNNAVCDNPALTTVDGAGDVGQFSSLALNSAGFPVISYFDRNDDGHLKVAVCKICVAPTLTTVDSARDVGQFSSLALNNNGFPVISYRDAFGLALKLAVCNDAACSSPVFRNIDSASPNIGTYSSLALNSNDFAVISYYDELNRNLKVAFCDNAACDNPVSKVVDDSVSAIDGTPFDVGKFTSLVLNGSGIPIISYYDETNKNLKVAACDSIACGNPTLNTIDDFLDPNGIPTSEGKYSSLALNGSGLPVISYYDETNKDLKLAVCTDAACENADVFTVDASDEVGEYSSLALNSNGFAVISYYDATNDKLKIAVCKDSTCTQPAKLFVDDRGDVGKYTTLALTSSDMPIISYYDDSNNNLKVAVCNASSCRNPTLITVDGPDNVGEYSSMALNSSGYPVISYYDGLGNANLKVVLFELPEIDPGGLANAIYLPVTLRSNG